MDLAYELTDLVRSLRRWAERALRAESMTYNSYVALELIARLPKITGSKLALRLGVSEATTSTILRGFREAGFVVNTAESGEGNIRRWVLTEDGVAKREACSERLANALDADAHAIGEDPEELAETIHALHLEALRSRAARGVK